jgi:hypothetical protein
MPELQRDHLLRDHLLRDLTEEERARYFRGVLPLWGGGLPEDQFVTYQRRLANSDEAEGRYRLLGLFDGGPGAGTLLSALKVYLLAGQQAAGPARVLGIGAVFTPPEHRRRGHAAELLRRTLALYQGHADLALLFTDIGIEYYRRLGFRALESRECRVELARLPKGGGYRPAAPREALELSRILSAGRASQPTTGPGLSLSRDGWVTRFQLRRLRELARIRGVGEPEWGILAGGKDGGEGAAMVRHTRDAVDVLDAAWTSPGAREALFAGLRDCLIRSARPALRVWPAHQLRGLWEERPRTTAVAMVAPLGGGPCPEAGSPAELALLDHI